MIYHTFSCNGFEMFFGAVCCTLFFDVSFFLFSHFVCVPELNLLVQHIYVISGDFYFFMMSDIM